MCRVNCKALRMQKLQFVFQVWREVEIAQNLIKMFGLRST